MLLSGRAHRMLTIWSGDETVSAQLRMWRTIQLCTRAERTATHGGSRPESGHPSGPRRQLQVLPALPHARYRLPRRQDRVASALQRRVPVLDVTLRTYSECYNCLLFSYHCTAGQALTRRLVSGTQRYRVGTTSGDEHRRLQGTGSILKSITEL